MMGTLLQPLLYFIIFGFGFRSMYASASGGANYINFLAPGIITMVIFFTAVFSGLEVVWDRQFGFLKETLVAPISRAEIMIGQTLGGATIAVIQGLIMLGMTYVLGFRISNMGSLGLGLIFMFVIAILFSGISFTIASKMKDQHGFQMIMNLIIVPVFFLSGAFFPLTNMPYPIYLISMIDPLTYGVDGLRGAITGISNFGIYNDLAIIGTLSFLICIIGKIFFTKLEA